MTTCFFCGAGSRFDNQMKIITISVSMAHIAVVESAETVMSYFVSLICGERTGSVARALGFSAIDMGRPFRTRDPKRGLTLWRRGDDVVFPHAGEGQTPFRIAVFYRIVSILTKNSMLSTKKLYAITIYIRQRVGLSCGKVA